LWKTSLYRIHAKAERKVSEPAQTSGVAECSVTTGYGRAKLGRYVLEQIDRLLTRIL
jgi:hypothetical protein